MKRTAHRAARDLVGALRRQTVRVGSDTPGVRGADWRIAVVATVNPDNTVTTEDGITVRRWECYLAPAVGDIIGITQSGGGSWGTWGRWATGPGITRSIQSGTALMSWTAASAVTAPVTFPAPFATVPRVTTNIQSGAAEVARWVSRASAVTATGFTAYMSAPAATNTTGTNIPLQWIATTL
ncbi:H-type lectin domain-containing protein [Streptomyces sp. NBC_01433]|uniref:H-type lectin domain-containing protein n=1 Tax=Streptomyces sp. NBC_01433 TaxID=2903864 RepID=UPI002253A714|nr:H-type lectin domain-containing protein [Streptomyces sp. NBC_01433]MCX4676689.1 H-type lectin domain-containing protein [Streptomyces sp. NBC_01433]